MKQKIQINAHEHLKHPLRVHKLLNDFELEDVWRFPIELTADQTLQVFMDQFNRVNGQLLNKGSAAWLFKVRIFLGRIFGWDKKVIHNRLFPGSIRARYAEAEALKFSDLPDPGSKDFVPVYQLENEFLSEIENKTVHAAIHFSRVPLHGESYAIQLAVYVKPKGWLGRIYMWAIKPFRLWIVYPAMFKAGQKRWEEFVKNNEPQ